VFKNRRSYRGCDGHCFGDNEPTGLGIGWSNAGDFIAATMPMRSSLGRSAAVGIFLESVQDVSAMLLKSVTIKNFRCFKDVTVPLDKMTVLIGENNSGKTSFLEAIRLCLTRSSFRRSDWLDQYDYHLPSEKSQPDQAEDLSIALDFVVDAQPPAELVQALGDVLVFDDKNVRHVILRTTSSYDKTLKSFTSDWDFLDAKGNALGPKVKRPQVLATFAQLVPLFYLSALRDAAREFQGRSAFWAPFLKSTAIPSDIRDKLQTEINALNEQVLKSHGSLQSLKTHLAKVQNVVASGKAGTVDIEALPGRISDLLAKAQINFTGATGASLPLTRHGAGTQSLAVIFLFEAFLATMLAEQYDKLSQPILALEEPEAHLHPCATRSLWTVLDAISGQKVIATHSGDLLGRVPLSAIRRFCTENGVTVIKSLLPGTLTTEEEQKVNFHIQSARGELLFARCWLLGEGETEFWVFREAAEILGHDLDRSGVRFVNTRYSGVEPLLKIANAFGIQWYFVGDGDKQGTDDAAKCKVHLVGREEAKHISRLPNKDLEVLLCVGGFGSVYENHVSAQKKGGVTAAAGTPQYWEQVVDAQPNKDKPARAREVMDLMRQRGKESVPPLLKEIIDGAISLAEGRQ
jgi:putative ATP-dependent endonuclease of OLD family